MRWFIVLTICWLCSTVAVVGQAPSTKSIAFISRRDGAPNIYVMDADGANVRRITQHAASDDVSYLDWSSDGRTFSYLTGDYLRTVRADGSDPQLLLGDAIIRHETRWSGDGSRIAYYSRGGNAGPNGLHVIDPATKRVTFVTKSHQTRWSWFPDGRRVLHSNWQAPGAPSDLYAVDVVTGAMTQLTDDPVWNEYADLSPNGARIAYWRGIPGGTGQIVVFDLTSGESTEILKQPMNSPTWSPDGREVALSIDGDLYVMDADGGNLRALTAHPAADYNPTWFDPSALTVSATDKKPFTWGWLKSLTR
ncbi:MAG: hypothetical protein O3A46_13540 [Candidatus Poribacteria bacterium]|nr:hypothetical protein [Candidatus Poribacteria bacterium]